MNAQKRQDIFNRWREANPHPATELVFNSNFELLIAVVLSAQATDVGVNKATGPLFKHHNTPQALLELGLEGLKSYINTIGLFNTKANNVIKTCAMLIERHNGEVPADREALEALPGVGRKTANVVLNIAFKQPAMAVDTHIFRVANRTKIAAGKNVLEVEKKLLKCIPDEFILDAHHWLLLHGRYTCVARTPKCAKCIILDLCEFKDRNKPTTETAAKKISKKKAA